jgi:hypothetical protein
MLMMPIDHPADRRVPLQPAGDFKRIGAVRADAQRQGLQAAQGQETVERPLYRAGGIEQEPQALRQLGVIADHRDPADQVGMAAEILGGRMHDDIGAEFEGPGQQRRREGVVDNQQGLARARDLGGGGDIHDLQHGIGRSLQPDHPGLRPQRPLQGARLLQLGEGEIQPGRALAHAAEQAEGAAVQVVTGNDMIAAVQQFEQGRGGGHAGSEREAANPPLQVGDAFFVSVPCRVVAARVLPSLVLPGTALHVGRTRVDRRHDGAGGGIGPLSGVDRPRGQAQRLAPFLTHR